MCSLHFPDQKKSNLPGSPNYVPSIFPHQNGWVQPTASDKFKRSLKRKRIKAEQKLLDIENETLFPEVMIKVETPSDLVDQSVQTSENINTGIIKISVGVNLSYVEEYFRGTEPFSMAI